jgi:threonine-phosphate decarboxylase
LAETEKGTAALLKDYLAKNHHLLIRDASNFQGLTPRHFRVSTQSPEENDWLVAAIREYEDDGQR